MTFFFIEISPSSGASNVNTIHDFEKDGTHDLHA